jgi:hypothetical protein
MAVATVPRSRAVDFLLSIMLVSWKCRNDVHVGLWLDLGIEAFKSSVGLVGTILTASCRIREHYFEYVMFHATAHF